MTYSTPSITLFSLLPLEHLSTPLLSKQYMQLKAKGSGFEQDFSIELSGAMQASCFNVRVVRWEPLCEPWRPVLTASLGQDFKGTRIVRVNLACEEVCLILWNLRWLYRTAVVPLSVSPCVEYVC